MADLDVSDVLDDPDFASILTVVRFYQTVDGAGRTSETQDAPAPFQGVVQPASAQRLARLPEGTRIDGAITIRTRADLTSGQTGRSADVVTWQGNSYTVKDVQPWAFGSGYFDATCELVPFDGGAA